MDQLRFLPDGPYYYFCLSLSGHGHLEAEGKLYTPDPQLLQVVSIVAITHTCSPFYQRSNLSMLRRGYHALDRCYASDDQHVFDGTREARMMGLLKNAENDGTVHSTRGWKQGSSILLRVFYWDSSGLGDLKAAVDVVGCS